MERWALCQGENLRLTTFSAKLSTISLKTLNPTASPKASVSIKDQFPAQIWRRSVTHRASTASQYR
jgi:hypothetical protein